MPYTSIPDVNRHTKEIVTIDAPFPLMSYSSKISGSKRAKTKQMRNTTPRNAEIPHWMKPTTRPKLSRLQQKAFLRSSPSIIADFSLDLPKIIRKDYQQRRISNDSTMRMMIPWRRTRHKPMLSHFTLALPTHTHVLKWRLTFGQLRQRSYLYFN